MFNKKNMRSTKAAIIALLLATSTLMFSENNAASALKLNAKQDPQGVNPDFVSSMSANHWKLYQPSETLDMYRRAEYKANKQEHLLQVFGVKNANAQDNLEEAQKYLKQAENTIVKLKTELRDFANKKDTATAKIIKQNQLYKDGKQAMKEEQAVQDAAQKL